MGMSLGPLPTMIARPHSCWTPANVAALLSAISCYHTNVLTSSYISLFHNNPSVIIFLLQDLSGLMTDCYK